MRFSNIHGHGELKEKLLDMVKGKHVPHALLFNGTPGSPTLPIALAFSTLLNCENYQGGNDACGTCPSCSKSMKFIHPDHSYFYPVSSTAKVPAKDKPGSQTFIKEWRNFLLKNPFGSLENWANEFGGENKKLSINREEARKIISGLSLKAFEGKYKIILLWLPEHMHPAGANAILKILEEPSESTVFLLVSEDSERLLGTIKSRTQSVFVRRFDDNEIINMLVDQHQVDKVNAENYARLSDGNFETALRLSQSMDDDNTTTFRDWMRECFKVDMKSLVARADSFSKANKISQRSLLRYSLSVIREALIYKCDAGNVNRYSAHEENFIIDFSKVIDEEKASKMSKIVDDSYYYLDRNGSPKIVFLDLSLQMIKILRS